MFHFKPEGMLLDTAANRQSFKSLATLQEAQLTGKFWKAGRSSVIRSTT